MIEIGLESGSFNQQLKGVKNSLKSLEKDFKNFDKGLGDTSKSITALAEKQKVLSEIQKTSAKEIQMHVGRRDELLEKYQKERKELDDLAISHGKNSKEYNKQSLAIESTLNAIDREEKSISGLQNKMDKYSKIQKTVNEQYENLSKGVLSYTEQIEGISKASNLTNTELETQSKILESQGKMFKKYKTEMQQVENQLTSSVKLYKTHKDELKKNEQEYSKLQKATEEHSNTLKNEQNKLESIKKTHGNLSEEYRNQANNVDRLTRSQIEYETSLVSSKKNIEQMSQTVATSKKQVVEFQAEYEKIGGSSKLKQNLVASGKVLQDFSESTASASVVSGAFGAGSTKIYMNYEQGLAKLSTLSNLSKDEMEAIGRDIIRISNETGTSVGMMLEASYQAVSGGQDIGNLNEFLTTSSKLATAGFADTDKVVNLLNQSYNTLGSTLGDYTNTADKLLQVQNLGVTDIAQLSTAMGEPLSLASAFSVSFDDICASFIKTTKAKSLVA